MIKVVIFDFFDVLRTDGFNRWLRQNGYEQTGDILAATQKHDRGDLSDKEFFKALADITGETADQVETELEANNELNQSLVEYIDQLKHKYKIALLSNSASEYLRNEIAKYDLEKYFDEIVISSEVGLIKPEPAVFEHILQKLSASASECVFTDDNPKYVNAANDLGINGLVFKNTQSFKKDFESLIASQS